MEEAIVYFAGKSIFTYRTTKWSFQLTYSLTDIPFQDGVVEAILPRTEAEVVKVHIGSDDH